MRLVLNFVVGPVRFQSRFDRGFQSGNVTEYFFPATEDHNGTGKRYHGCGGQKEKHQTSGKPVPAARKSGIAGFYKPVVLPKQTDIFFGNTGYRRVSTT